MRKSPGQIRAEALKNSLRDFKDFRDFRDFGKFSFLCFVGDFRDFTWHGNEKSLDKILLTC